MRDFWKRSWFIVWRHWLVYRKDFLANISPTLADPVFIILSLGFGLSGFVNQIEGRSYIAFLAPGLIGISALMTSFFETSYAAYFRLNFEGVYKAMMTTPIGPREIIAGEFAWVAVKGAAMSTVIGIVLACFQLVSFFSIPALAFIGSMIAISCGALGTLSTTFVRNINQFQTIYSFLISPLYFLSGIFFPVSRESSEFFYWIIQISPLYHGVRILQEIAWGTGTFNDFFYHSLLFILITVPLVSWAVIRFHRKLWV